MAPSIVAPRSAAAVMPERPRRAAGASAGPSAAVGRAIPKSMIDRVLVDDHDVRRLEIAVDDARVVRGDEPGGDIADEAKRRRNRERPRALEHARESAPSRDGIVMYLMPSIVPSRECARRFYG